MTGIPESAGPAPAAVAGQGAPLLSVVKGRPTPEELAALTAVVLSLGQSAQPAAEKPGVRHWVRRQQLRLSPKPGPDAWRRSLG